MRHIIPISGKDSLTTALVQQAYQPDLPYEYVFNQTYAELPEMLGWLDRVERRLGKPIHRIGANLEEIIAEKGILPSHKVRFCTQLAKIFPLEDWLGTEPALVYFGIRADEQRIGYQNRGRAKITPVYPLQQFGLGLQDVWGLLEREQLMPPLFFWQTVYETVYQALGPDVTILDRLSRPVFYQLFAWRSRPNCYYCFYQRLYELVGLLEHHPDLYWHACEIEETTGGEGYTWRENNGLRKLATRAAEIRGKRVQAITQYLQGLMQQRLSGFVEEDTDMLNVTSCGLLCGK